jgi:hypothetical protein
MQRHDLFKLSRATSPTLNDLPQYLPRNITLRGQHPWPADSMAFYCARNNEKLGGIPKDLEL